MRSLVAALMRDRRALIGLALLGGFVLLALLGPFAVGERANALDVPLTPPSWRHLLGTTGQGADVLAQTVLGARKTLAIGLLVGVLVTLLGVVFGVAAGYAGGRIDDLGSTVTNVFLVIPGLPLTIIVAAYLPRGPWTMALVLTVAGWAWCARVFRSETLTLRQRDFVSAARLAGESHWRIVAVEILPNMASLVAASFIGTTVYAIGAQVGLEFLGLGDLASISWGTNLYWASNDAALLTGAWWTFVPTGLCVALVGFALTLVGFAVDEMTNPRLRGKRPGKPVRAAKDKTARGRATLPPVGSTSVVEVRALSVQHEGAPSRVVDDVSFEIRPGEIFGLAGESGSGKSTIAHALLRLLPDGARVTGELRVSGVDVTGLEGEALRRWRWRDASIVFQSAMSALNPVLTVGAQLVDTLRAHDRAEGAHARAAELLQLVGVDRALVDAWPHQLSGGMRQRVGLALAMALEPRLLVLDEPTTALDVVVQRRILEQLLALQRTRGFAVLFITHDLPLLLGVATRIGILRDGRLLEVATADELKRAARHPYTRLLLSSFPSLPPLAEGAQQKAMRQ
jgi:peptide/nickel transport system permease protein